MTTRRRIVRPLSALLAICAALLVSGVTSTRSEAAAATPNPIQLENQQPGTSDWRITGTPSDDTANQIKGYASATSVNVGGTITLFVTVNPGEPYSMDVYRMGYYQGLGGRLMQHVGPLAGVSQPGCPVNAATGMVACNWAPSYQLQVPTSWVSGIYLVKLTNVDGFQNYITFTVRDDASTSALLLQQSVTTYEAYNNYPNDVPTGGSVPATGKSLYDYNSSSTQTASGTSRALQVSFDRPYSNDDGAGDFLDWEFYFVRWIEQQGYDVSYTTDVDTDLSASLLQNHHAFLSIGHDEYWSSQMVDNVTAARDAGVNLGFFGANAMYWQVRFSSSADGSPDRIMTCYKSAVLDPVNGPSTTVQFRQPPVNRPEQQVIGIMSTGQQPNGARPAPYVVNNANNWVYANAGVNNGDSIPNIVGYETDRQVSGVATPSAVPGTYTLLSTSPYAAVGGGTDYAQSSVYEAASGAWVFAAGSIEWSWGLYNYNHNNYADPRIQQITANVLNQFSSPPQPPPAAPTNLSANPSSSSVVLSWTDRSGGQASFVLQRSNDSGFANPTNISVPAGQTTYTDSGLDSGAYYYRVQAVDSGGGSPYTAIVGAATTSYQQTVQSRNSLISYWRLDEMSGATVALDQAGNANGQYLGGAAPGAPGAIPDDSDTAASFDGSTGKISLPSVSPVTDFSIEAWSCLPAGWTGTNSAVYGSNGTVRLLARPGGTASGTEVYVGVWLNGTEYTLQPKATLSNAGQCVQWDVTRAGGTLTVYRNGAQIGQRTDLPAAASADISGWIGAQSGSAYYAVGRIDDVSVYGAGLSAGAVQNGYIAATNGLAPPTPPTPPAYRARVMNEPSLTDYWRLDESAGPSAADSKGTANGTYQGRGITYGAPGALANDPDTAIGFDGATAKISLPQLAPVNDFTIEAWTCLPGDWTGANSTVYGTNGNVRLLARPGGSASTTEVYAGVWLNGTEYTVQPKATAANTGSCVMWDVTRAGSTLTVYRNGSLIASRADLPANATANISGWIGATSGTTYYAVGRIDDVSLYSSALSAAQVYGHYVSAVSGPAPLRAQ